MVKQINRDIKLSSVIGLAILPLVISFQHNTFQSPVSQVRTENRIRTLSSPTLTSFSGKDSTSTLFMSQCLASPKYRKTFNLDSGSLRLSNGFQLVNKAISGAFQINNPADRVTIIGSFMNLVLSAVKFAVGVRCHSTALVSDGVHSLSDLISDFITLVSVRIGRLPPSKSHPDGFKKYEAFGSLIMALAIIGTGVSVGLGACGKILRLIRTFVIGASNSAAVSGTSPGFGAFLVAFLSVISKEWLFRITKNVGEELNSHILIANAKHHRSDAFSSVLAMGSIGIAMSIPGMQIADVMAGLFVSGMICTMGIEIMSSAINLLKGSDQDGKIKGIESQECFIQKEKSLDEVFEKTIFEEQFSFDFDTFASEEKKNLILSMQKESRSMDVNLCESFSNSRQYMSQIKVSNRNLESDELKLSLLLGPASSFNVYDNKLSENADTDYSSPIIPQEEIHVLPESIMNVIVAQP